LSSRTLPLIVGSAFLNCAYAFYGSAFYIVVQRAPVYDGPCAVSRRKGGL
jgi:hypothetical protein